MKHNNTNTINRRNVLKKLGAAGVVGSVGLPAGVSAETTPSDAHVENILEEPQIRRIREEIGSFTVQSSTVDRTQHEGTPITKTTIETNLGTLINAEIGSTAEAVFELNLSSNPALHRTLPAGFKPVPAGSTTSLRSDGSSVTFTRETTDTELEQLEQAVDAPIIGAAYTSDINGFTVIAGTVDEETTDVQQYHVGANGGDVSADTVEPVPSAKAPCWLDCAGCVAAAVGKGLCAGTCASLVATAACLACIFSSNVGFVSSCASCGQCIT